MSPLQSHTSRVSIEHDSDTNMLKDSYDKGLGSHEEFKRSLIQLSLNKELVTGPLEIQVQELD